MIKIKRFSVFVLLLISFLIFFFSDNIFANKEMYNKAVNALHSGNTEEAKVIFKTVFTNTPNNYYAPYSMFQYARLLEDVNDVLYYLKKITNDYPDFNDLDIVYNDIGTIYFLTEDYENSKTYFYYLFKNFKRSPLSIRAMFYIGKCFFKQGNDDKSLNWYDALYRSFPKSEYASKALFEMGFVYEGKKDYDRSLMFYTKLMLEYPDSTAVSKALYRKALIYGGIKHDAGKAQNLMATILAEYPESFEAEFVRSKIEGKISEEMFITSFYTGDNRKYPEKSDKLTESNEGTSKEYAESSYSDTEYGGGNINVSYTVPKSDIDINSLEGTYYIQLGAFGVKESAVEFAQKLNKEGFNAKVFLKADLFEGVESDLYIVLIGFFKEPDPAKSIAKSLRKKGYECFIGII